MQPKITEIAGVRYETGRRAPWRASVWAGIRLSLVFLPTTFIGGVLMPLGVFLYTVIDALWDLFKSLLGWASSVILVLILGLCGRIRVLPNDPE